LWRRTTFDQFRTPHPQWENLLDLDKACRGRKFKDWFAELDTNAAANPCTRDIEPFARRKRRVELREFDMATKTFVADGFALPEAKAEPIGSMPTRCCL